MAWIFGDSFDLYATTADMMAGYWDSGSSSTNFTLVTGRFSNSRALSYVNANAYVTKASGQNDPVHHLVYAFEQTQAISGTAKGAYFNLTDGATTQCSIVHQSDGSILLTSGANGAGTVLATYSGAITVSSVWYAFEVEVVISNTAGSFRVRANGSTTDSFSATGLNTRNGTVNSYANSLTTGLATNVANHIIDDLLWRSDATSGSGLATWVGDIRCYTRLPSADASVQFTPNPVAVSASGSTAAMAAGTARYTVVAAQPADVSITSVTITTSAAYTGNIKCAIFANNVNNQPGVLLGTATSPITNPVSGSNTFSFSPAVTVPENTQFFIGLDTDSTMTLIGNGSGNNSFISTVAYASFPVSNPTGISGSQAGAAYSFTSTSPDNYSLVNEQQQDGATTYVYDSTVGHADFYNIASIPVTPVSTIAVTTRGFAQKSDAGTRSGAVQLKSGSSIVTSPSTALLTGIWSCLWRIDVTDPSTGSAWTATGVNNAQVGPTVTV